MYVSPAEPGKQSAGWQNGDFVCYIF
jgi:hypothetical protein